MKLKRISASLIPVCLALSAVPMLSLAQSYEVVELPITEVSENQFASSIDNTGLMLSIASDRFNQPIDLSLISLDALVLSEPDAAEQGDFNAVDLEILTTLIYANTESASEFGQKLSSVTGYLTDGSNYEYLHGFDTEQENTNGYTYALNTLLGDSVYGTFITGSMAGPYSTVDYISQDAVELTYNVNEFLLRGFVQVGDDVGELTPFDDTLGGYSEAHAINENLQVAGESSVEFTDSLLEAAEACEDFDTRGDVPLEVCNYNLFNSSLLSTATRRATIWQVDNEGDVVDIEVYGLTFEPDNDATIIFSNEALDINNLGQAVGYSPVPYSSSYVNAAVIFENGETRRLLIDDELLPNRAISINDNGVVVGYLNEVINNISREQLFVYNINTDELVLPNGFFTSSSTIPTAVNDNGIVIGTAEADADERRSNGFLYDINAKSFYNINDLTPCDSEYEIIAANDINDDDVIVADALVSRISRNSLGVEQFSTDGEPIYEDTVIAVQLVPTGGEVPDCDITDEEEAATERQGAAIHWMYVLAILTIVGLRRRRH